MDAVVSFQLGTEPVTLGETRVDFEAQGLADHRVVLHSLWVVPSRDLPPEVMRQATEAVDGRHEVTHVELGLSGRLRPDARLDYQNWSWSLAIMNALDDSPEQHATNLIHGQWFPPGGEEVGQ